jgi:hypothetical protein
MRLVCVYLCLGLMIGCAKQIVRPDQDNQSNTSEVQTQSDVLGINPTVNKVLNEPQDVKNPAGPSTYVYFSTHDQFPNELWIEFSQTPSDVLRNNSEALEELMILDDQLWINQVKLTSSKIVPCDEDSIDLENTSGVETEQVTFQSYLDVMIPEEENSHLVMYEFSTEKVTQNIPTHVEVILDGNGAQFYPNMVRLTDALVGKAICFSLLQI